MDRVAQSVGSKYECSVCDKRFSRIDHLKRHHLRHSGLKPYVCTFCSESFTRCDNLRQHYPYCTQRGNKLIPETSARGRRPHACDSESSSFQIMRAWETNIQAVYFHEARMRWWESMQNLPGQKHRLPEDEIAKEEKHSKADDADDSPSDRGSVKFLLNCGTASFMEQYKFPPADEPSGNFSDDVIIVNDSSPNTANPYLDDGVNDYSYMAPLTNEPVEWSFFNDDMFMQFISGPFGGGQLDSDDSLTSNLTYQSLDKMSIPSPNTSISMTAGEEYDSESILSASMIQGVLTKTYSMNLDDQTSDEVSRQIHFLLSPGKIGHFVKLFFDSWHPHCQILHLPSFSLESVPVPLLLSVILMGAMYSPMDQEVYAAKRLLDLAELYIFSMDEFSEEYEIRQTLKPSQVSSPAESVLANSMTFKYLQAAFLMVIVQFWSGSQISKKRAKEIRFGVVVKIARRLGLTTVRHELTDSLDESSWIMKESQIRTMHHISLLDCAFVFFKNYPCRVPLTDTKYDLPCDDALFAVAQPFSEPQFRPSRHLTTYDAFYGLFKKQQSEGSSSSPSSQTKQSKEAVANPMNLNSMDMFVLIHLLCTYIYTHISLLHAAAATPQDPSSPPSAYTATKTALSHWRALWMKVRSQIPAQVWATMGFYRNAYNYWLVAQLLVSNRENMGVAMGMTVCCEDTLKQLRSLLKDGGTEE